MFFFCRSLISNKKIFEHIYILSEIILSLPHSNAEVERIFSICSDIKTKKRNKLNTKTLSSLIKIKLELKRLNSSAQSFPVTSEMRRLYKNALYSLDKKDKEADDTVSDSDSE